MDTGENDDDDEYLQVVRERRKLQELIAKLEKKDRLLYQKQLIYAQRKVPNEQSPSSSALSTPPPIPELERPKNAFWGTDKVALVSYPRSGNSLLRRMIEKLTGTVTGSDARPDRELVRQLAAMGMRGEGVMDSRVWCVKTHYPERVGRARLVVTRAILIVRNPFDSIASYFQMMLTSSHNKSVSPDIVKTTFAELWADFLYEEISLWVQFHAHWRQAKASQLVIRYEDLVQHKEASINKIADFLYGPFYAQGTVSKDQVEAKIQELLAVSLDRVGIYAPKASADDAAEEALPPPPVTSHGIAQDVKAPVPSSWPDLRPFSGGFLKALSYFTRDQYRVVLAMARSDLVRYGYWDSAVSVRPEWVQDMIPFVDVDPGECIAYDEEKSLRLNSRYPLRPRTEKDPYGRGFDIRWEQRLAQLPPVV